MRFFSPPEKPVVDRAAHDLRLPVDQLELLLEQVEEVHRVDLLLAARLADLVVRRAEEVGVGDAGNLHRVLEGEEDARLGPLLGLQLEQILPSYVTEPPVTS